MGQQLDYSAVANTSVLDVFLRNVSSRDDALRIVERYAEIRREAACRGRGSEFFPFHVSYRIGNDAVYLSVFPEICEKYVFHGWRKAGASDVAEGISRIRKFVGRIYASWSDLDFIPDVQASRAFFKNCYKRSEGPREDMHKLEHALTELDALFANGPTRALPSPEAPAGSGAGDVVRTSPPPLELSKEVDWSKANEFKILKYLEEKVGGIPEDEIDRMADRIVSKYADKVPAWLEREYARFPGRPRRAVAPTNWLDRRRGGCGYSATSRDGYEPSVFANYLEELIGAMAKRGGTLEARERIRWRVTERFVDGLGLYPAFQIAEWYASGQETAVRIADRSGEDFLAVPPVAALKFMGTPSAAAELAKRHAADLLSEASAAESLSESFSAFEKVREWSERGSDNNGAWSRYSEYAKDPAGPFYGAVGLHGLERGIDHECRSTYARGIYLSEEFREAFRIHVSKACASGTPYRIFRRSAESGMSFPEFHRCGRENREEVMTGMLGIGTEIAGAYGLNVHAYALRFAADVVGEPSYGTTGISSQGAYSSNHELMKAVERLFGTASGESSLAKLAKSQFNVRMLQFVSHGALMSDYRGNPEYLDKYLSKAAYGKFLETDEGKVAEEFFSGDVRFVAYVHGSEIGDRSEIPEFALTAIGR